MPETLKNIQALAEAVRALKGPVAVVGHVNADGDAVGSVVGFVELLRARGVPAFGMTANATPEFLKFLTQGVPWREATLANIAGCALVALDSAAAGRLGALTEKAHEAVLAIDHHVSHEAFARQTYVEPEASSTSEIVVKLAREMGVKLSAAAVNGLYAGIVTDTFRFAYCRTGVQGAETLEASAWLAREGASIREISERLTNTTSRGYLTLLSRTMAKTEFLEGGAVLLAAITEQDFKEAGASWENKDRLVAELCTIEGVRMAALVIQREGGCRMSLRAKSDRYRVDKLCAAFGGGGHASAAAVSSGIKDPLQVFLPRLREALLLHWKTYGQAS